MSRLADFIREDVASVLERDPAVKSRLELYLCYSELHAAWLYRINHQIWKHHHLLFARRLTDGAIPHRGSWKTSITRSRPIVI